MVSILATGLMLAVFDIGEHFAEKESWDETATDFAVEHIGDGFNFVSQKRDVVNCMKRGKVSWLGCDVWETRIYYNNGAGAKRIEMSLYNRGDAGPGDHFLSGDLEILKRAIQKSFAKDEKEPKDVKTKLKSRGLRYERCWPTADPAVELSWGVGSDGSIQFVKVTLTPKQKMRPKGATKAISGQNAAAKVKANVKKNGEGDVWIDGVPMVDQGQKGYCAAAVSERLLRYYGHDIDEHEIAQQAGSQAQGGTRVSDMIETIRAIGVKKRLGFNQIVSMAGSFGEIEKEIESYNKTAKSMKEDEISLASHMHGNMVSVNELYDEMKPKVLKKMRTKDSRYKKFLSGVKTQVDKGIPICWGVTLGIFPEPGLNIQGRGGHMRLIIGYNAKTGEVLYTDTWGAGHELKRIPEDWAFAITHDAFFLRPL